MTGTTRCSGASVPSAGARAARQPAVDVDDDLDDRGRGPGAGPDHGPREDRQLRPAVDQVDHHHRLGEDDAGRHVDHQRVEGEGVVEPHEGAGFAGAPSPSRPAASGCSDSRPSATDSSGGGGGHRGQDAVEGHDQAGAGPEGVHQGPDPVRRRAGVGVGGTRSAAPGVRYRRGPGGRSGCSARPRRPRWGAARRRTPRPPPSGAPQPGGPGEGGGVLRGERRQDRVPLAERGPPSGPGTPS